MISLDTETTGVDFYHGSKPFIVTTCDDEMQQMTWEWFVNPLTREPIIPDGDVQEIGDFLFADGPNGPIGDVEDGGGLILQNPKFDFKALETIGLWEDWDVKEVWRSVRDTLLAGHLVRSNGAHGLTDMTMDWLRHDIQPLEDAMETAVQECRRYCRSHLPNWRIAKEDMPELPSAKSGGKKKEERAWKLDCWLPRALVNHWWKMSEAGQLWEKEQQQRLRDPNVLMDKLSGMMGWEFRPPEVKGGDHRYWTVTRRYADEDSTVTIALWKVLEKEIKRRGYWKHYLHRLKVIPIAGKLEENGITGSVERLETKQQEYIRESYNAGERCREIAKFYDYDLELPKSGNNGSLLRFCFGRLNLPVVGTTETGNPSLDKDAMDIYEAVLPEGSRQREFILSLRAKRKRDTAIQYMNGYRKFMIPLKEGKDWFRLHPNLNPTGTGTLRWSSSNPNEQNISKKEDFNLRYAFGPKPGREWFSMDYKNIERRIPVYLARQEEIIALFERPDDPPYYGSEHLLVAHIIYRAQFETCIGPDGKLDGRLFKKRFPALYQRTKNGNFAVQYGAVNRPDGRGTADLTYGVPGAQSMIEGRFTKLAIHNQWCIDYARKHGYVETLPDKTVDPKRGYPLMCTRTENGDILPTVPLNYEVQGSAMQASEKAMIRCQDQFDEWYEESGYDGFMTIQQHDELVFDLPKRANPLEDPKRSNLSKVKRLAHLMELSGDDIGIPLPVNIEWHPDNWSVGIPIAA